MNGRQLVCVPDDEKLQERGVKIVNPNEYSVVAGTKVLLKIVSYSDPLSVSIARVIGHKDDPGVDILSILLDYDIIPEFPQEVMICSFICSASPAWPRRLPPGIFRFRSIPGGSAIRAMPSALSIRICFCCRQRCW